MLRTALPLALALALTACQESPADGVPPIAEGSADAPAEAADDAPAAEEQAAADEVEHEVVQVPEIVQGTWAPTQGAAWTLDNAMLQQAADGGITQAWAVAGVTEIEGGHKLELVDATGNATSATVVGDTLTFADGTALTR